MPILQRRKTEAQRGEMTSRHSHSEGVVAPAYYCPLHYDSEPLKRTPLRKRVGG